MKLLGPREKLVFACFVLVVITIATAAQGAVNVTQYHNHETRDGLYVDPALTRAAAAGLKRDLTFQGIISGNVYAQPLYLEDGPGGTAMIIAVTESNNVYALDAANGSILWQRHVGQPVPRANLPCGNIDPVGITGTPVVDLPSRTLFFDAMTTPDSGTTRKHLIFALNVNTNLDYFKLIVPCGISDKPVTSLAQEMAQSSISRDRKVPALEDLAQQVARNFGRVFEAQTLWLESLDALFSSSTMSDYDTTPANQDTPARSPREIRELGGEKDIFLA